MRRWMLGSVVALAWIACVAVPMVDLAWIGGPAVSYERRYALSAAILSFAGAVWTAAGVVLTPAQRRALAKQSNARAGKVRLISTLLIGAHEQLFWAFATLVAGLALQVVSTIFGVMGA